MWNNYKGWRVKENNFPRTKSLEEKIKFLINYTILAPSTHNSQPWLFKIKKNVLEIYADLSRKIQIGDQEGRMLYISLGCALANLEIAAQHFLMNYQIGYLKDENIIPARNALKILRISFTENKPLNTNLGFLFRAITQRNSNRKGFKNKKIQENDLSEFKSYSQDRELRIDFIEREEIKKEIAEILGRAMGKFMGRADFRKELASWLRHNWTRKKDGMPGNGHNMSLLVSLIAPYVLRNINVSKVEAKKAKNRVLNFPLVGIISAKENTPLNWLKTGELFERIALGAKIKGLDSMVMVAIIEDHQSRQKLRKMLQINDIPQFFFGLGYAEKPSPLSPRRGIEEVLI